MRRALPLMLLASCGSPQGADGYQFERKDAVNLSPPITVVEHPTLADLRAAYAALPSKPETEGRDLMAWSALSGDGCVVHIVDPAVAYAPEWLGHEVAHCLYGRWHG